MKPSPDPTAPSGDMQEDGFSRDFAQWPDDDNAPPWDLVIVGSGYGASVAAATLAGCTEQGRPLRVCMLERGREYRPGDFAASADEWPAQARVSLQGQALTGRQDALWDLRLGTDVSVLLGNGLGGGSLINAAVMAKPLFEHHAMRFPASIPRQLHRLYLDAAQRMLGGSVRTAQGWQANTIERHPAVQGEPLPKTVALKNLALPTDPCHAAAITIHMRPGEGEGQAAAPGCSLCGDCLSGCNVGAKASLDTQLLPRAKQRGLQIFTRASVLRLNRQAGLWHIEVVHTDPATQAGRPPVQVRARRVIVAAGALGSTEILMRSSRSGDAPGLALSSRLGRQFSGNGDNLCGIETGQTVRSVGDEFTPVSDEATGLSPRRVGPEITQTLHIGADQRGPEFLVQEFSIPASLRRVFEELITTRRSLDELLSWDRSDHRPWTAQHAGADPLAVDRERIERTLLVGLIGHDASDGAMVLEQPLAAREGSVQIQWPQVGSDPAMADAYDKLAQRVRTRWGAQGRLIPNPVWRPLPQALAPWAEQVPGAVLTVHPLGGCALGESASTGVVDEWGAVFQVDRADEAADKDGDVWQGTLLVLDGAIVPASLGANPALTIAALSLRAARHWRRRWGWTSWERGARRPEPEPPVRVRHRPLAQCTPAVVAPTEFQIVERLSGVLPQLQTEQGPQDFVAELTLGFKPVGLDFMTAQALKRLELDPRLCAEIASANTLRVYPRAQWEHLRIDLMDDADREAHAVLVAGLSGHMDLAQRGRSVWGTRLLRAGLALLRNRGGRDLLQAIRQRLGRADPMTAQDVRRARELFTTGLKVCTQAGEWRVFDYQLQIGTVRRATKDWQHLLDGGQTALRGHKRLTYARGQNPWNQLLYLHLTQLGPLRWTGELPPLKLDARFLALKALPLIRVTRSAGPVRDAMDWASMGLYWARLLLKLHAWSFRQPDPPSSGDPQRLPQALPGLPVPELQELELEPCSTPGVRLHLTRFAAPGGTRNPLLLVHGYSVSGNTFAHPALRPSMAEYFWRLGRDVWIVDLRTSTALPTATLPWQFEDVAWADIPLAVQHIAQCVSRERGGGAVQVDVFAHCIGAVMLSMALLTDARRLPSGAGDPTRYPLALQALKSHLGRVVLSQKGFAVRYVGANLLRAHVMGFVEPWLQGRYDFRPAALPSLKERLFDAVLASLPYPDLEWAAEHPWLRRVPWSATRRRMDVLYERTFNIAQMPLKVLQHIDDLFGPLNLQTVSEVRRFARTGFITPGQGHDAFVPLARLREHWPAQGTLLLSARDSGMVDPHTTQVMADLLAQSGLPVERAVLEGGHQDSLIGQQAEHTFARVAAFLDGLRPPG